MGNTPFFTLAPPSSYTLNLKTLTKVLKVSLLDLKKWWVYVFLLFLTTETLFYQDLPKVMKSNVFCLSNHQDLKADQILTVKSLEPKGTLPINTLEIQPRQGNKTTDKSYAFKRLLTAACILKKTYHNTKNGISPYVCMMIKKRRGRFSAGTGF